jgi:hypothetical protein
VKLLLEIRGRVLHVELFRGEIAEPDGAGGLQIESVPPPMVVYPDEPAEPLGFQRRGDARAD